MGPRYRTFAGMVICMFFALGLSLLALLGYLLRNWYTLSLATSVPFVLLFRCVAFNAGFVFFFSSSFWIKEGGKGLLTITATPKVGRALLGPRVLCIGIIVQ
jgi:hypothetical protein